jgi:hypothetical protein
MRVLFKVLIATIFALGLVTSSWATTYNVDIDAPLPDGVSYGPTASASTNACSATTCAGGFNEAYTFVAQPGDTINFGTVSLSSFIFGDGRQEQPVEYVDGSGQLVFGFGTPTALYGGSLGVSYQFTSFILLNSGPNAECNSGVPSCIPDLETLLNSAPAQYDLSFTLPDGFIEFGWTNPSVYTPPEFIGTVTEAVPEPSTWAMLLVGFAGIGFAAHRRRGLIPRH